MYERPRGLHWSHLLQCTTHHCQHDVCSCFRESVTAHIPLRSSASLPTLSRQLARVRVQLSVQRGCRHPCRFEYVADLHDSARKLADSVAGKQSHVFEWPSLLHIEGLDL